MSERKVKFQSRITANWEKHDTQEGRVVDKGVEEIEGKKREFMVLDTKDGEVRIFETEGLREAFDAASVGDFVKIEFLAMVETSKGRNFRQFRSQVWEDPDAPPIKTSKTASSRASKKAR